MPQKSLLLPRIITLLLVLATLLIPMTHTSAQAPKHPSDDTQQSSTMDTWEEQQRKVMLEKANLQRQQEIKKDAEKLLELATELKQSVDKSNANTLSLDVVKKAEQIEKLANRVKDKMRGM